ncbi:MAG TPA: putative lipoprotein [Myxococcota bacterium]|nr:putative lipoprotein [Myxococcota bacterium]
MTSTSRPSAPHLYVGVAAACLALASFGCSFSDSSKSISDSVNHSSDSSGKSSDSSSSSSKDKQSAFADDVVQYTQAYVQAGGSAQSFFDGVGDLARKRGVSDWEAADATWISIGRGLGMTHLSDAELVAYEKAWAAGNSERMAAIQRGVAKVR